MNVHEFVEREYVIINRVRWVSVVALIFIATNCFMSAMRLFDEDRYWFHVIMTSLNYACFVGALWMHSVSYRKSIKLLAQMNMSI